jgi:hypothetical protein
MGMWIALEHPIDQFQDAFGAGLNGQVHFSLSHCETYGPRTAFIEQLLETSWVWHQNRRLHFTLM